MASSTLTLIPNFISAPKKPVSSPQFFSRSNHNPKSIPRRAILLGLTTFSSSLHLSPWPTHLLMASASMQVGNTLDSVVQSTVKRSNKNQNGRREEEEEVLVIEGIEVPNGQPTKFDVLINALDWAACGPGSAEFAGSFVHVPRKPWRAQEKVRTCLRLGIGDLLRDIGAADDKEITVTLVPRAGSDVRVGAVRIESSSLSS